MKRKPNRTFVYLALVMVFLLVISMTVVAMLVSANRPLTPLEMTSTSVVLENAFGPLSLTGTMTQAAILAMTASYISFTPSPYDELMSPTAIAIFIPLPTQPPTLTFTPVAYSACSWQWARQPLDDVGMMALEALIEEEMTQVSVRAEAYGENCIDGTTNTVNYFAAMTTDFYLDTPFANMTDEEALADFVVKVYHVLSDLPEDALPARLGYLDITFTPTGTSVKRLRTTFDQIRAVLLAEVTGAELIETLGGIS